MYRKAEKEKGRDERKKRNEEQTVSTHRAQEERTVETRSTGCVPEDKGRGGREYRSSMQHDCMPWHARVEGVTGVPCFARLAFRAHGGAAL